jgi:uncharacterized protein DUF3108
MAPGLRTCMLSRPGWNGVGRTLASLLGAVLPWGCVLLCSCASTPSAAAPAEPEGELLEPSTAVLPRAPETLRADVAVSGVHLGKVVSSWCPSAEGGRLATEMKPSSLVKVLMQASGSARTELDLPGGAPSASEYDLREGDVVRSYQVSYREGRYDYRYDRDGVPQMAGLESVPEQARAHDMQSALMALRAWRPRLDASAHFYVVLGRRLWRADVHFAGPEVIKVDGVPQLTSRVDGTAQRLWEAPGAPGPRTFSIWFGEQGERAPVRLTADGKYGPVTMTLTGRGSALEACGSTPDASAALAPR